MKDTQIIKRKEKKNTQVTLEPEGSQVHKPSEQVEKKTRMWQVNKGEGEPGEGGWKW